MELIELQGLSEVQYAQLVGDETDPWGVGDEPPLEWRPKEYCVALCDHETLIASAGLVVADVQFGGESPIPVVGIGGVIVAAKHRGQGLGRRVISEAVTRAEALGPTLAMLFCLPDRAGLYRRHGFEELLGPVFADQSGGVVEMPPVAMWRPLQPGAQPTAGAVTVRGLPF